MNHKARVITFAIIALLSAQAPFAPAWSSASADAKPISRIADPHLTEASALAVSVKHPGIAYTINDSGHKPIVYAVEIATGQVVGKTSIDVTTHDTEALALAGGTLWIGDTGSNTQKHPKQALIAIAEPGTGTHKKVSARRYRIHIPGHQNTEALLAAPGGQLFIVTKHKTGHGIAYRVDPEQDAFHEVRGGLPALVTDGAFAPDGSSICLLTYTGVYRLDPATWRIVGREGLPPLKQAESLAYVGDRRLLLGSEGADSPLYETALPAIDTTPVPTARAQSSSSPWVRRGEIGLAAAALVAVGGIIVGRRRRRERR